MLVPSPEPRVRRIACFDLVCILERADWMHTAASESVDEKVAAGSLGSVSNNQADNGG